jgi:putative tryptophan/tyrosine transport system substrate-binding protein
MGEGNTVGGHIRILLASRQEVRELHDLERAAAAAKRWSAQALLQLPSPFFVQHLKPLVALLSTHQLPTLCETRMSVVEECLMAYEASFEAMARRTAYYVDRILKGTAPADLSVGESDKFEFIVNLKVVAPAHRDRRDWTTAY